MVKNAIKLDDVIEALEFCSEERKYYFNKVAYVITSIGEEEMRAAEDYDDDSSENNPEWQREEIEVAIDILENSDNYLGLPTRFEVNEYDIMLQFCDSLNNDKMSSLLSKELQGNGAFKRFKGFVNRYNIETKWYEFRDEAIKRIAIGWCEENNINII
jgi:hypothetical protein